MARASYFPELTILESRWFPELSNCRNEAELREARRAIQLSRLSQILVVCCVGLLALVLQSARDWLVGYANIYLPASLDIPLRLACTAMFVIILYRVYYVRRLRIRARATMIAMGIPLCRSCGYNQSGVKGSRCPECGEIDTAARSSIPQRGADGLDRIIERATTDGD